MRISSSAMGLVKWCWSFRALTKILLLVPASGSYYFNFLRKVTLGTGFNVIPRFKNDGLLPTAVSF